jgi:hypothetical protein
MKSCKFSLSMFLTISMFCSLVAAQQGASTQSSAPVPRLVNFTGKAADAQGKPIRRDSRGHLRHLQRPVRRRSTVARTPKHPGRRKGQLHGSTGFNQA